MFLKSFKHINKESRLKYCEPALPFLNHSLRQVVAYYSRLLLNWNYILYIPTYTAFAFAFWAGAKEVNEEEEARCSGFDFGRYGWDMIRYRRVELSAGVR